MPNAILRGFVLPGAVVLGTVLLGAGMLHAQQACNDICFEQGEAWFTGPDDIAGFLADWHERLGLTGNETFVCVRQDWIGEFNRFPDYAYLCNQTELQGYATRNLYFRIDFWDREGAVRNVRCQCLREDVSVAAPRIRRDEAAQRGMRYVRGHYPEVDPDGVEVLAVDGPLVQPYSGADSTVPYRTVWQVAYGFPWTRDHYKDGEWFETVEDAGLVLGIDAVDNDVVWARDGKRNLSRFGIPADLIDAIGAELSAIGDPVEQFEASQRFFAFAARGESALAASRIRVQSLAEWEPDSASRYLIYFATALSLPELADFLEEHALDPFYLAYVFNHEGQFVSRSVELRPRLAGAILDHLERTLADARADALNTVAESRFPSQEEQARLHLAGLSQNEPLRISSVEAMLNHVDARRLLEREIGGRVLILTPNDRPGIDLGLGWLLD